MSEQQLKSLEEQMRASLACQAQLFEQKLAAVTQQLNSLRAVAPEVEIYQATEIIRGKSCDEPLDIVKSLPEFDGKQDNYVSWRQAAITAYKVFESYNGSSRHYQAIAIIRNKIRGPADAVLASFNTVLNFKAIIARLDFTYADKTPVHVIQQNLSILRQGDLPLLKYYEDVERNLTLLTNKTLMTYDPASAAILNEKYRIDALHTFVSGLRKSIKWAVFPAQPRDLPTALALAQEAESSNERGIFMANYAKHTEEKSHKSIGQRSQGSRQQENDYNFQEKSPVFQKGQKEKQGQQKAGSSKQRFHNQKTQGQGPEPMEVDSSSRFRQPTQAQNGKQSQKYSDQSMRSQQKLNHLPQERSNDDYENHSQSEATAVDDDLSEAETCNFLGVAPCFRTSHVQ